MQKQKRLFTKEHRRKISEAMKGRPSKLKGKKGHPSHFKGMSFEQRYGTNRAQELREHHSYVMAGHSPWLKGRHQSEEAKEKNRLAHLGKTSWNAGIPQSEEAKEKNRLAHSDEKHREIAIQNLKPHIASWTGRKHRPETKLKISEAKKKQWQDPEFAVANRERLSKEHKGVPLPHTPEWNAAIGKGMVGHIHSPEARIKMSESHKTLWLDPDYAKRMFQNFNYRPNATEAYLDGLLQLNFPQKFKYLGGGEFWVAGHNPDFVDEVDKLLIEYCGYKPTHTPEADNAKAELYAKEGWRTLNIYPVELPHNPQSDPEKEQKLINRIKAFIEQNHQ